MTMGDEMINTLMSSLGMEDMNIPELKINQATGGDYAKEIGTKLGQLYNSTTGDMYDTVDVQILHIQRNRTYWGRTDITDDPPICSSLDGVMSVNGDVCKTGCPYHAYRERANIDKDERRKECQAGFVVLCLDEQQMPLVIRLNGISADAGRNLAYQAFWNKALKQSPGGFFFRVSSSKKKTAAGEAWEFKFLLVKDKFPEPALVAEYNRIARELITEQIPAGAPPEQITQNASQETITSGDVGKIEDVIGEKQPDSPIPDIKF